MKLHHCAFNVTIGSSETVQKLLEHLGGKLVWEGNDQGREIAMQFDYFVIQISEIDEKPRTKNKIETHIAFYSNNPEKDMSALKEWCNNNHLKHICGKWKENELWIDLPDIFVNFVIEILRT